MTRQFVACRFKPGDTRLYTFINEGEPVQAGDFVEAISRGNPKIVEVVKTTDEEPPFECAPVTRKVDKPESWKQNEEAQASLGDIDNRDAPTFD